MNSVDKLFHQLKNIPQCYLLPNYSKIESARANELKMKIMNTLTL